LGEPLLLSKPQRSDISRMRRSVSFKRRRASSTRMASPAAAGEARPPARKPEFQGTPRDPGCPSYNSDIRHGAKPGPHERHVLRYDRISLVFSGGTGTDPKFTGSKPERHRLPISVRFLQQVNNGLPNFEIRQRKTRDPHTCQQRRLWIISYSQHSYAATPRNT